jgi:hypothetical protein
MYLEINTNTTKVYEQYLTFLKPILDLTSNEVKVLAALLFLYQETAGAKEKIRWSYVFSTEGKESIRDRAGMNANQLNLTFTSLRKKEILLEEPHKHIASRYIINPVSDSKIVLIFNIADELKKEERVEVQSVTSTADRDNSGDREEVQSESSGSYTPMVSAVPQYKEEDKPISNKRREAYLSPEEFSRHYAIPVRQVYSEPKKD